MEAYIPKITKCTCPPQENYPDVAMSTDCQYFHKLVVPINLSSSPRKETFHSKYGEDSHKLNFTKNMSMYNFNATKMDLPQNSQLTLINNKSRNNKKIKFFNPEGNGDETRKIIPVIRNCQQCTELTFHSFHHPVDHNTELMDVFESFEMLNRSHVTDESSIKSYVSDDHLNKYQLPESRRRIIKERKRIRNYMRSSHGYVVLCFVIIFLNVAFGAVIAWMISHKQNMGQHAFHSISNWTESFRSVSMNWSLDEDTDGWAVYMEGSKTGSRYKTFDLSTTFQAAQEFCEAKGGYLPRIQTIREQVFIEELLNKKVSHDKTTGGNRQRSLGFWIGGRRSRGSHGGGCMFEQWKWVDLHGRVHGHISGFTAFAQGKPDNIFDPEECLYIVQDEGLDEFSNLKWDDTACDVNSLGGIKVFCEVELG